MRTMLISIGVAVVLTGICLLFDPGAIPVSIGVFFLCLGAALIVRGHSPERFTHVIAARLIEGIPEYRHESKWTWFLTISASVIVAAGCGITYQKFAPKQANVASLLGSGFQSIRQLITNLNTARSDRSQQPSGTSPSRPIASSSPATRHECPQATGNIYEFCSDAEVGQFAVEEAGLIMRLFNSSKIDPNHPAPDVLFIDNFKKYCLPQLKVLRPEVLARYGPIDVNPREAEDWKTLNLMVAYNIGASLIAEDYAKNFRAMGIELVHRSKPRQPSIPLRYSISYSQSDLRDFPIRSVIELTAPRELDAGYIAVVTDSEFASMGVDLKNAEMMPDYIQNKALLSLQEHNPNRVVVVKLGQPSFVPEAPLHVVLSAKAPLKVTSAFWFDE